MQNKEKLINKLKNPKSIALITLGLAAVSVIDSIVQGIKSIEYFDYTIYEILMITSLFTIVYLMLILFKKNINIKKMNIIMIIQYIIAIALLLYFDIKYGFKSIVSIVWVAESLLPIILLVNFYMIVKNKKYNPMIFLILEYIILLFIIIPIFPYGTNMKIILSYIYSNLISRAFLIPFIFYMYLYGKSKNRKELK